MIYEVKYTSRNEEGETIDVKTFTIDDMVIFDDQPEEFKKFCREKAFCEEVIFDNAIVSLQPTGRVLVCYREE